MDVHEVRHITLSGTYCMRWDEMTLIEVHPPYGALTFNGPEKQFAVLGYESWPSSCREKAITFFTSEAELHNIPVVWSKQRIALPRNAKK